MSAVISILSKAFINNRSVAFVVKQDSKREKRIKLLMAYSLFKAYHFGRVFMNPEKTACALVVDSSKKKMDLSIFHLGFKIDFSMYRTF